jgi:hypothetical protein
MNLFESTIPHPFDLPCSFLINPSIFSSLSIFSILFFHIDGLLAHCMTLNLAWLLSFDVPGKEDLPVDMLLLV